MKNIFLLLTLIISIGCAHLNPRADNIGKREPAGGMDRGGGGLLHYRLYLAQWIARSMILGSPTLENSKNTKLADTYKGFRSTLLTDTYNTKILIEPSGPLATQSKLGAPIYFPERYWDGTLGRQGVIDLPPVVRAMLRMQLEHMDFGPNPNKEKLFPNRDHIPYRDQVSEIMVALEARYLERQSKPSLIFPRVFSTGWELTVPYKVFDEVRRGAPAKRYTLDQKITLAKEAISKFLRLPKEDMRIALYDGVLESFYGKGKKGLLKMLGDLKFTEPSKVTNDFGSFFSKHSFFTYKTGQITLSRGLEFSSLDEITYLLLHEVGHGVENKIELKLGDWTDFENLISGFASRAVLWLLDNDKSYYDHVVQDNPNLDFTNPMVHTITLTNVAIEGKPVFYKLNPKDDSDDPKFAFCRWVGLKGALSWESPGIALGIQGFDITNGGVPKPAVVISCSNSDPCYQLVDVSCYTPTGWEDFKKSCRESSDLAFCNLAKIER